MFNLPDLFDKYVFRGWPMIAANPVLFGGIVLLCFMIALLIMRWWFKRIIDTKDCTITNQDSTIANLNSHIGILNTHLSHAKVDMSLSI